MMKNKYLSIFAAAAAVLVAAACNKPAEEENSAGKITIAIQPEELSIGEEGGALSFSFTAPDYWFASSPEKWINIEPYAGKPGSSTVTFTVSKNTVAEARSAVITVNAKGQKGQIKLTQSAWPYTDGWSVVGTIGGSNWDKDFYLEDQGDGLIWKTEGLPFHAGEAFKFRMGGSDAVSVGLDGGLTSVGVDAPAYVGVLKQGGENISLPADGYWDVTLDLNDWTITAVLVDRFPWSIVGTIGGGSWDADFAMVDKGDKLLWEATEVSYHFGEEFKFRMDGNDAFSLGLDGELEGADGGTGMYRGALKQGGANITLPLEGYWNLTLDVEKKEMEAVFVREFTIDPPTVPAGWAAIWKNDDTNRFASWDSYYRFAGEGFATGEEVCTIPAEQWEKMKSKPFYVLLYGGSPQIRVTTGWWSTNLTGNNDIQPGSDLLTDNGNGYWTLKLDLSTAPDLVAAMDQQHLLLTGGDFTVFGLYYSKDEWRDATLVMVPVWENDGSHGEASWDGLYRFGLEGHDGNNECIATFPQEVWDRIKSETFYVKLSGNNPQVRVTTGWWSTTWTGQDIQPGNELLTDNGDGTWTLEMNLYNDASLVSLLDEQHLLFTGGGFAVQGIYFLEEFSGPKEVVFWENDGSHGAVSWDSVYRFGLEGHDGNNECIATLPPAVWDVVRNGTFYMLAQGSDWVQMRITTGWWSITWTGEDISTGNERIIDNGDGTYYIELNFTGDPIQDLLDEQHLLFTGGGFTPLKLYYYE
jgi:hypothetical protein